MDERGVNKRTYKNLKKEIVEDTALNVGYYPKVINKINYEILLETFKEISLNGWINENTDTQELANMLVTESVKNMGYQEFKDIADNFFSFVPDDKEKYYRVSTLEITRENYDYLVSNTKKVFGLERKLEEIENKQNSIDTKINNLETKVVPSDDKVLGIDLENEEILLLKSPLNVYIDEDLVIAEEIINDYKSDKEDHTQILDYLIENYDEIELIHHEYVLNNDTYMGMLDIDTYELKDITSELDISQFKTHKEYYDFANNFTVFSDEYKDYADYINKRFDYIYSVEYLPDYSKEILQDKINEIDKILEKYDTRLIIKDIYGYSSGEHWQVGYLSDIDEDVEKIEDYIENTLGAWYKGELTELQIISFDAFEKGEYIGEPNETYYINSSLLYRHNKLDTIQKIYPELNNFETPKNVLEKQKQEENKNIDRGRSL